ncbi:MAG: SDR family oxidoreductase [Gemmatimonadales bacterium]|nr:SDR family oxidoreductase [Gemmatimonadales bacterium]
MPNVLITGSSRGIGYATALAFARAGYQVAATMRDPARAPELARAAAAEKLPIRVSAMDVDDDASVSGGVARIVGEIGPIDVLVNNAGIERNGSVEELPLAEFKAVMETNYFGAVRCIQAVLPAMRERRSGCIINVSSVAGRIAIAPLGSYSASKFALEAISEALAQEVKRFGICVAIVEPGIIDTAMAHEIATPPPPALYPNQRRNAALFAAVLTQPVPPSIVAEKIVEIAGGDSTQLRHPVGPDAAPFLGWRNAMTDEQWVDYGSLDDGAWYERIRNDFGIDLRETAAPGGDGG